MDSWGIADRFELYQCVGSGGMGVVYRAQDRLTGDDVALKLLLGEGPDAEARFLREARVLEELHHPAIVCYRTHGRTASGELYLVMEWLDGEDLQKRLEGAGLTVAETVALGRRVADALAFAHARGIVHRDIKPGNLFLVNSQVERVKLLDFGIARVADATRLLTSAGGAIGTLGYMAPEQARGCGDIDARADVFSLGCVLFECLSGKPAFAAEHPAAVLAKILFEDAPGPGEISDVAPRALCELVARMLAKEPAARPTDASEVAAELSRLDFLADLSAVKAPCASALTAREQRAVHMIAVVPEAQAADWDRARTLTPEEADQPFDAARAAAAPFGARVERLADGTILAAITGSGSALDQAACAARCAIALRAALPASRLSLSMGRCASEGRWSESPAIDRAVGLVSARSPKQSGISRAAAPPALGKTGPDNEQLCPILLDDVTAGLLDERFDVVRGPGRIGLRGEREERWTTVRRLLGKPTPCVGRERELAVLLGLFDECAAEPRARVALVTGPAGIGKSRLRHELLLRVRARAEPSAVWIAQSDFLRAGSPFSILSGLLQHAANLRGGEPLEERRQKLRERLEKTMGVGAAARATAFLGELVSAAVPDEENRELGAARRDASLMAEQVQRAWEAVLAAECAAHPTVLILEDLQWGDPISVKLLDRALRSLKEQPLLVLAFARPAVHDLFPKLWQEREVQEIRLGELSRKACERLVQEVLGSAVTEETVERVAALSEGNAFYLEELIRAVAEGRGDELPETVLAMVEARLSLLPKEARQVLRAGSVFGEMFQQEGVQALLEGARPAVEVKSWLSILTERELLMPRTDILLSGNTAFAFRHALLREGAYATLTDADRTLGHRLAAVFLEGRGDSDRRQLFLPVNDNYSYRLSPGSRSRSSLPN